MAIQSKTELIKGMTEAARRARQVQERMQKERDLLQQQEPEPVRPGVVQPLTK